MKPITAILAFFLLGFVALNAQTPAKAQDAQQNGLRIQVLDKLAAEPIEGIAVMFYKADSLLGGALTDQEGKAFWPLANDNEDLSKFNVQLRYAGRFANYDLNGSNEEGWRLDFDPALILGGVEITEYVETIICYPHIIQCGPRPGTPDKSPLYRPLDEFLMMNSSQIHHSGRW